MLGLLFSTFSILTIVLLPTLEATNVVVLLFMMTIGRGESAAKIVEGNWLQRVGRRGVDSCEVVALAGPTSCEMVI